MKKLFLISLSLGLISIISSAQQNVKIDKAAFKLEKPDFNIAWENVREGDRCYKLGGGLYPKAAEHYLKALEFNSENAALNYKLGVSCLLGDDPQAALSYFLKARSLDMEIAEDLVLLTGRAYQFRGDYSKAIDFYNMYSDKGMENGKINPVVNVYIKECNLALEMGKADETTEITNLGPNINSAHDDYSPVIVKEQKLIYFTTRRPMDEKEKVLGADMKFNENIFIATDGPADWSEAGPAGTELVTELNEGVLYVDNDNTTMYVYAGWSGSGDILVSYFENGLWTKPGKFMDITSSPGRETSIALTPDGTQIYFTSDRRKGNFGGRDIYFIRHIKKKKWSSPINLGPLVNSSGNEEAVWTSVSGDTIWFSSNGRDGYGGYDIFMSVRNETGEFSEAVNLGMPVNSQWNDLFYRQSSVDRRISWFSSNRPGGEGGLDIYRVRKVPVKPILQKEQSEEFLP